MLIPACPYCPSTTFAVIRDGWINHVGNARQDMASTIQPQLHLIVCTGCGHSAWFHDPESADALREVDHRIVHTGDEV